MRPSATFMEVHMHIERTAHETILSPRIARLRENCIGCRDCKGPCHILLQLSALPDIVLDTKRANH